MNPKNNTCCQPARKERGEREREGGRKIKKHKNKEQGLGIIVTREEAKFFTFLKPQGKKKRKQRKTFHGYRITEEKEDEEGSLTEDRRTKHLLDCCHQG